MTLRSRARVNHERFAGAAIRRFIFHIATFREYRILIDLEVISTHITNSLTLAYVDSMSKARV